MKRPTINVRVARRKGWYQDEEGNWYPSGGPHPDVPYRHPPDFCGDLNLAAPLLEELIEEEGGVTIYKYPSSSYVVSVYLNSDRGEGVTLPEAITRAHDAWKTAEKEAE